MKTLKEALFSRKNLRTQNIFKLNDDFRFEYMPNERDQELFIGNEEYCVKLSEYHSKILYNRLGTGVRMEIMDEFESENSIYYDGRNTFEIRTISFRTLLKVKIPESQLISLCEWFEQNMIN